MRLWMEACTEIGTIVLLRFFHQFILSFVELATVANLTTGNIRKLGAQNAIKRSKNKHKSHLSFSGARLGDDPNNTSFSRESFQI